MEKFFVAIIQNEKLGSLSVHASGWRASLTVWSKANPMQHLVYLFFGASMETAFRELCAEENLWPEAVCAAATIDLKAEEPGLLDFCAGHGWPLTTYSAKELRKAEGMFTPSAFVERTTGVDNVCERSAVLAAGGPLLTEKHAGNGVTMALAWRPFRLDWRWKNG